MEIRSITLFCEPDFALADAARFFAATAGRFAPAVQTRRVAFTPFPGWWPAASDPGRVAETLVAQWQAAGADYLSLGPVQLRHDAGWLARLPDLLGVGGALFASAEVADTGGQIDLGRCAAVAHLVQQASRLRPDGFGNLYLAALAHCPAGSPFFPVAYHGGGPAGFALAVEAADIALAAIQAAATLAEARHNLVSAIEQAAAGLAATAGDLAQAQGVRFSGIDFSLAPFPSSDKSLAGALEALGLPHLGAPGSLFAAAFITEAIGRASFPRCGFSGLMLPVLEDNVLAARAAAGQVGLTDLLSYAAVCGVGLDTVPLPGDVSEASLTGILLDVAALATRLKKPLTARLMPLPGLSAGDPVTFDFPYFADSRVMPVPGRGVAHLLAQPAQLSLRSRAAGHE